MQPVGPPKGRGNLAKFCVFLRCDKCHSGNRGGSGMILSRFELEMVLSGASERNFEMTSFTDNSFPYVLICSTFTTVVSLASVWIVTAQSFAPALGRLGTQPSTSKSKDVRHDPQDDKTLVSVCACEQHSGNHPCQHDRGLARYRRLHADSPLPPRKPRIAGSTAALPPVTRPRRRRLDLLARSRSPLLPLPLEPASPAGSFLYMLAAIDEQLGAVDVARLLGAEEIDGLGDFFRLAEPSHGICGDDFSVPGDRIGVSISPGEMALTLMPRGAKSAAISRVSAASAALEVA